LWRFAPMLTVGAMRASSQLLLMLGAAVIVVACEDSGAPTEETCPTASARLCFTTPDTIASAILAVEDIAERSATGLVTSGPRTEIQTRVPALSEALGAGRVTAARDILADLRESVAAVRSASNPGDAPDLAGIELALLVIERLL
jgi:hypothetical protein